MAIETTFRDDNQTQLRVAWQKEKQVQRWTRQEIEAMHKEAPHVVWAWGCIPFWKVHKSSNVQVEGAEGCLQPKAPSRTPGSASPSRQD
jgi:hypothetical protein